MGRKKKLISREIAVFVRFTEAEFKKIRKASTSKTNAEAVRSFALKGAEIAEQDIRETTTLISKLENADLSKIADKLDMLLQKMNEPNRVKVSLTNLEILHEIRDKINEIAAPKSNTSTTEIRQLETLSRQIIAHVSSTNVMLENLLKK